ncbi:hypothetical protein ACYJ1Y_16035 [Natrialbaceae archaeon A-gly3]
MPEPDDTQPDDAEEEYITRTEAERLIDKKTRDIERKFADLQRALGGR